MTPDERLAVVAEAKRWRGTPYHSNAAVRKVGCDCALGPLAIYREVLPWLPRIEPPPYIAQWHMHRGEELYLEYVRKLGGREVEQPEPGDFVLFRQGRLYSHGAIVLAWPNIIHAVILAGMYETNVAMEPKLARAARLYFTL